MSNQDTQTTWRQACAAALAGLKEMSPLRLAAALEDATPEEVWEKIGSGELVPGVLLQATDQQAQRLRTSWQQQTRETNPFDVLEEYHSFDVSIWTPSDDYPTRLIDDIARPEVLFWRGRPEALINPTVAIIGTRHCTPQGRDIARRFGAELAEAGVSVVSGLALGIDGAAHRGALEASYGVEPIGVVGSGLNSVYPQRNKDLWDEVGKRGLILSEAPLYAAPEPWRFPARNRIIAGLADLILVIESHEYGGSLLTVNEASERDKTVMTVPGSVRSPASRGTNKLLREGCMAACDVDDVLFQLKGSTPAAEIGRDQDSANSGDSEEDGEVLEAIGWEPSSTDDLLNRLDFTLGQIAIALARLQQRGLVQNTDGWWHRC